jgi:hypothetical protein
MLNKSLSGRSVSGKSVINQMATKPASASQSPQQVKARSKRPSQQWSGLKWALATGSIAATLLGTQLIATKDHAVTAPTAGLQLSTQPLETGSTIGVGQQFNRNQTSPSPFFRSVPRQSFRPLTRSRSSR